MKKLYTALVLMLFVLPLVAQNIPSYVPKDGLVGYWPFNGNANDESGNGNHGTVNGATLTADRNGVANSAYSFDGDDYIITLSDTSSYSNGITMSAWIDVSANNKNFPQFFVSKDWDQINGHFALGWTNNSIFGDVNNTTSGGIYTPQLIPFDSYINIVYTYDINRQKIYINGNLKNTNNYNSIVNKLISPIYFGRHENTGVTSYFTVGKIDDIAFYNRALSEQEVQQLYAGCSKETATSSNFNSLLFTNGSAVSIIAEPQGGVFTGSSIENNQLIPSKAKIGSNKVKYNFKNSQGCEDSTVFTMVIADTVGTICTKFDTVKVNKYDTVKVTKFDTITITNNVTKFDTVIVKTNVFDTVKVTKYDTLTITNNVTKYDTVIVNKTNYDTVSILKIKFKLTTGIHANQLSSLSIYPNPTSDVLHIEVPDAKALEGYRYRILDALGKEVYNQLVTQTTTEIPLKTLGAAGIYQFEILDAKNASIQSNKIVLQ